MICLVVAVAGIVLSNAYGRVEIDTHGALIRSYVPAGEDEVFLPVGDSTPSGWRHGGVPVCWPWFADKGPPGSGHHGMARNADFKVVRQTADDVALELVHGGARLLFTCKLGPELSIALKTENRGDAPLELTQGLHAYFNVREPDVAAIEGLKGVHFTSKRWSKEPVPGICQGDVPLMGANDIYDITEGTFVVRGAAPGRILRIAATGMGQLTVWNGTGCPANSACVEPIVFREPFVIAPGRECEMKMSVKVERPCRQ